MVLKPAIAVTEFGFDAEDTSVPMAVLASYNFLNSTGNTDQEIAASSLQRKKYHFVVRGVRPSDDPTSLLSQNDLGGLAGFAEKGKLS